MLIPVLFARSDSVYKRLGVCDVYDLQKDALNWGGGRPVIAHPPCRAWGKLREFSLATEAEKNLAIWAVEAVRSNKGVLEHPAKSTLWDACGLPYPNAGFDRFGGWTLEIDQFHWGHKAKKPTWLYIVGVTEVGVMPSREGSPTHCIRKWTGCTLPSVTKEDRERTPPELAKWLCALVSSMA